MFYYKISSTTTTTKFGQETGSEIRIVQEQSAPCQAKKKEEKKKKKRLKSRE